MGTILGARQSPVVLDSKEAFQIVNPERFLTLENYEIPGTLKLVGQVEGHKNYQLLPSETPPLATVGLGKKEYYELKRIHIHKDSEHLVDSEFPDEYEIHLVHFLQGQGVSGPKLVISILGNKNVVPSKSTHALASISEIYSKKIKPKGLDEIKLDKVEEFRQLKEIDIQLPPSDFFPGPDYKKSNWLHYQGSLTSEPFSEDVMWFVLHTKFPTAGPSLRAIEGAVNQDPRPPYPLERRIVVKNF